MIELADNDSCNFSFKHYEEIIALAKKKYIFSFFRDVLKKNKGKQKRIFLRHDIDISLEKALDIANLDKKHDVGSSFFIRPDSIYYNIFNSAPRTFINEIIAMGHQIGIHFDDKSVLFDNASEEEMIREIKRQIDIMKSYFNVQPIVSFHRPSAFWFGKSLEYCGLINTYDNFFKETKYLSDSRGRWKEGCICKFLREQDSETDLQLLIHPVWWNKISVDSATVLSRVLNDNVLLFDLQMSQEIQVYSRKFTSGTVLIQ